jgi:hypothetical protein
MHSRAENGHDGRIPDQVKREITVVMANERAFERALGPVATAWQSTLHAFDELTRADATVEVYRRWIAVNPDEPRVAEAFRHAVAEAVSASDWLEQCLVRHRQALRQVQSDAAEANVA